MIKQCNVRRKVGTGLFTLLTMLLLGFAIPGNQVQAGQNDCKAVFTVEQTVVMGGAETSDLKQPFTYVLEAVEAGNPLPAGNDGSRYTFSLMGVSSVDLEELVFYQAGEYHYRLFLKNTESGYQCDNEIYEITVYVYQMDNKELNSAVIAVDQSGYKCDYLAFSHHLTSVQMAAATLQVNQVLEMKDAVLSAAEQEFVYVLQAMEEKNPLPADVSGDRYTFIIGGSDRFNLEPIIFAGEGEYHYRLYLKEAKNNPAFTCDEEVYDIVVKTTGSESRFVSLAASSDANRKAVVTIYNQEGELTEELLFHHVYNRTGMDGQKRTPEDDERISKIIKNSGLATAVKTGDTTPLFIWLLMISVAALLIFGACRWKRKRRNDK